jgi:hypothetical protein
MDDPNDVYLLNSTCTGRLRANWSSTALEDGIWTGVTGNVGGTRMVVILNPGWVSSLDIGEDGELRPIDTQRYTQLTLRMRVASGAGTSRPRVEWANGPMGVTAARGIKGFQIEGDGLWHVYSVNLGTDPNWTSGPVTWLWFQLDDLRAGYRVEIDWVRLTPRQTRQVRWQGTSLSGTAKVYLGPNSGRPGQYGDLVLYERSDLPEPIQASARSLTVPASLPGGQYYARVEASGAGVNSSDFWRFMGLPVAEILAPSYTSGEDWATSNLGDPWDMESLGDISQETTEMDGIRSMRVSDGVLTVVNKDDGLADCAVPWPHRPLGLNLGGKRIDQTKYRYFSYRYKAEQAPDQGAGGVHRVRWQARHLQFWPTGRTDDLSFYHNEWQTYFVDLATVQLEGEQGEWVDFASDVMQIMLHESHRQWTAHLDWAKLTAENEARGSYLVRWKVQGTNADLKTTLYWARKQGDTYQIVPGSGDVLGGLPAQGVRVAQGHDLYLPYVLSGYAGESDTLEYAKSTQGLSKGQAYYVAIKLEDGYNESTWYSPVPVRVR